MTTTTPTTPTPALRSPRGIRAWRERHRLSQTALGNLLEVTMMTVYRWETGATPVPRTVELALERLEDVLS